MSLKYCLPPVLVGSSLPGDSQMPLCQGSAGKTRLEAGCTHWIVQHKGCGAGAAQPASPGQFCFEAWTKYVVWQTKKAVRTEEGFCF